MQHGETGAALPRHLARQRGKAVCATHNNGSPATEWVNRFTGKPLDRTGTFAIELRKKKNRQVGQLPA